MTVKFDAYEAITNQIIDALEKVEAGEWSRPWVGGRGPTSVSTGKKYRGMNVILLRIQQMAQGYEFPLWLTFNQAKKLGGSVKKDEKSTVVCFWKFIKKKDAESGEEKTIPLLRTFRVFNLDQCEGLDRDAIVAKNLDQTNGIGDDFNVNEACEAFIRNCGADIQVQECDAAFYVPAMDYIAVPKREQFKSEGGFYSTVLHELGHWTGHSSRCDRKFGFGKGADYAFEELVAEFMSAFICGDLGLEAGLQHPEYIKSWLARLRDDKRLALKAASQAQKAADYLWNLQGAGEGSEADSDDVAA